MQADRDVPQRIVFTGAECTGKTTLIQAISKKIGEPFSKEYVREYADQVGRPLEAQDLDPIARGQLRGEDEATRQAQSFVLHDTNLLSSILYAEHYFDVHIPWVDTLFLERDYTRYFFCMPDIPWEADPGQRVSASERDKLHSRFQDILARYDITPVPLSGTLGQRIQTVITNLKELQ
ncbi:ATP-binding protein [Pelagicoccus sp. SDUM812002]|uniref:ATP-binding protein n=1 Tax=Pelagicoccus sp. SDUM812002 TaxID=3041266 RepID=UPI00280E638A|nr:ATP-binding protein [Pelagicoccus sp. SDUM812002]MDQ8188402.1 ATP-binding protein [Pelagicoccus sp. SDUM812002]